MNVPLQHILDSPQIVLVVDDEPAIREILAVLLEDEGYSVRRARNGREALMVLNQDRIDLVLSDVVMPELDGASLVRRLRSRGYLVPVILMSAVYADVDLPGVHFVPKPFDADRLLDVVAGAIEDQGAANGRGVKPGRSNGTADDP